MRGGRNEPVLKHYSMVVLENKVVSLHYKLQNDNESESMFGFKIQELRLLHRHWRIPRRMRQDNAVFTGEEAMLIYLFHIRSGMPYIHMTRVFGGDPRRMTYYVRSIVNHLYHFFYHKISGDSMQQWIPFITDFRRAIWNKLLNGIVSQRDSNGKIIQKEERRWMSQQQN